MEFTQVKNFFSWYRVWPWAMLVLAALMGVLAVCQYGLQREMPEMKKRYNDRPMIWLMRASAVALAFLLVAVDYEALISLARRTITMLEPDPVLLYVAALVIVAVTVMAFAGVQYAVWRVVSWTRIGYLTQRLWRLKRERDPKYILLRDSKKRARQNDRKDARERAKQHREAVLDQATAALAGIFQQK